MSRANQNASDDEVERWNKEWLRYLGREWQRQLAPHTQFPDTPKLPGDPLEMLDVSVGEGPGSRLAVYCDREALEGRRVMELGCGCGNLGKLLGRFVDLYLGVDMSTLALRIARLVSPENCKYVHIQDQQSLSAYNGTIDSVVSRYFWIHQNRDMATRSLRLIEPLLRPGGRLFADFSWPDPDRRQFIVRSPDDALSDEYPSATFRYTHEDVVSLIEGHPFEIIREDVSKKMQSRYVILRKSPPHDRVQGSGE